MTYLRIAFLLCLGVCAFAEEKFSVDTEEWRDKPSRHFYIHGVWNGDTAFQILLPDKAQWKGRMMHFLEGGLGGSENFGVALGEHAYALSKGAIYVESSQGHRGPQIFRPETTARKISYEASYAVVQYAKERCVRFYGRKPDFTYAFGVSGGGVRSSGLLERFPDVYDGAVPVVGAGNLKMIWRLHSLYEEYRPAIQARIPVISERLRAGEDLYDGLTAKETAALQAILSAGYPRNAIPEIKPYPVGLLMMDFLKYKADPAFFQDFWKVADSECKAEVVEGVEGEVKAVDAKKYVVVMDRERGDLFGYTLTFTSGADTGRWHTVAGNKGAGMILMPSGPPMERVKPGDRFRLDNRDLLAWRRYHRHQARRPAAALADLEDAGRPIGKFRGKMIAIFAGDDPLMWPSVAFLYRKQVHAALGVNVDRQFRLHFVEHAIHGMPVSADREVFWGAVVHKSMDDLVQWVEKGVPAPSGYQPLVEIYAATSGHSVAFHVSGGDPDNDIVKFEMDFDGDNKFDEEKKVSGRKAGADFKHVYEAGTWFAAVRVTDSTGIQNVASIRVTVK